MKNYIKIENCQKMQNKIVLFCFKNTSNVYVIQQESNS